MQTEDSERSVSYFHFTQPLMAARSLSGTLQIRKQNDCTEQISE